MPRRFVPSHYDTYGDAASLGRAATAEDLASAYRISTDLAQEIVSVANKLGIPDPAFLANVINFESRFSPSVVNATTGATGLIQFMPQCVSADTQALTPTGWKSWQELRVGDAIISFNEERNILEVDEVLDLYVGQAEGCVRLHNKQFDFITTGDHRWYCRYKGTHRSGLAPRTEVRTTDELSRTSSLHKIIRAAPYEPRSPVGTSVEMCELLGIIAGDGTIARQDKQGREKPQVQIYQFPQVHPEVCEQIASLLDAVGLNAKAEPRDDGGLRWTLTGDRARTVLSFFDPSTHLKVLSKKWLFSLGQEQLTALQRGYLETDGSLARGKYPQFTQTERAVMDDFQLVSLLKGQVCNVRYEDRAGFVKFPDGNTKWCRSRYYTYPKTREPVTEARNIRMHYDLLPGSVEVWCPTTKNATWVARREGFVTVTGNTAKELGTTTGALGRLSAVQQMQYVEKYFKLPRISQYGPLNQQSDVYMAVFYPAAIGKGENYTFSASVQKNNPGIVTAGDYVRMANKNAKIAGFAGGLTGNLLSVLPSGKTLLVGAAVVGGVALVGGLALWWRWRR